MINYRVENLDALLELLQQEGVEIDPKRENTDYGRFAWIMDPEGNRIEIVGAACWGLDVACPRRDFLDAWF